MSRRLLLCATLAATTLAAGCTADTPKPPPNPGAFAPGAMRLVAFDSCEQLTEDLRKAAKESVGPWGFGGGMRRELLATDMAGGARAAAPTAAAAEKATPDFSGTNVHEQGADEPDIVKTDGRRILTVHKGSLRIIDAATRSEVGTVDLDADLYQADLLLAGDRALVLAPLTERRMAPKRLVSGTVAYLVDLTGTPRVISTFEGEGELVDARLTGATVRMVTRSSPKIDWSRPTDKQRIDEDEMLKDSRKAIDKAPAEAWLPEWSITTGGDTERGRVGCGQVSRPPSFSGSSMVTVFSFDLAAPALSNGDPVSVVADGDTVYGTPTSLYVASDTRWWQWAWRMRERPAEPKTEIFRFDLPATGKPVYSASGSVPGWLVNQYALSEWDGHLRIATTTDGASAAKSSSAIRVLAQEGDRLSQVGIVDGLGKGERIYSARFLGPRGYVVTFRQTDPLYSVDLSDHTAPEVTGELKITGYSSHLQPAGENRLIGIGQEADTDGRVQGTQISLFDVSDPAAPTRLAQHHVRNGNSEAEYDPHAVLWWPKTSTLVVPIYSYERASDSGALALRVTDSAVSRIGEVKASSGGNQIRRSLVIGDVLWTLSDADLTASSLSTLSTLDTVRF